MFQLAFALRADADHVGHDGAGDSGDAGGGHAGGVGGLWFAEGAGGIGEVRQTPVCDHDAFGDRLLG